jgi:hypothetical protein
LLHRECNAAVPIVDVGEDIFAFRAGDDQVARIQVKTANAKPLKTEGGYTAQFSVPLEQLGAEDNPPLFYILTVRLDRWWEDFIVINRTSLNDLRVAEGLGTESNGTWKFTLSFRTDDVRSGGVSLQRYRNVWDKLPPLETATGEESGSPPGRG